MASRMMHLAAAFQLTDMLPEGMDVPRFLSGSIMLLASLLFTFPWLKLVTRPHLTRNVILPCVQKKNWKRSVDGTDDYHKWI